MEAGVNPARSRRCNGEAFHIYPLGKPGKDWKAVNPKSENLPKLYTITLRLIECVIA